MSFYTDAAALKLIAQLFDMRSATDPIIPLYSQKPRVFLPSDSGQPLPRCAPERVGLSSAYLADYLSRVRDTLSETDLHSLMIVKDGNVILDTDFPPYCGRIPHTAYSFSKTITGMAIGVLIGDGLLSYDDKPLAILRGIDSSNPFSKARKLTIRHLLTMQSGASFNEAGATTSSAWVNDYFSSFKFEPGCAFDYNSMNSFILAAVVCRITGKTLTEFVQQRIFEPLGIDNFFWEKNPNGIEKGGWGLYLRTEDMAKLGLLYLNSGRWGAEQIIPEDYVRAATSCQAVDSADNGGYNYGFQLWTRKEDDSFLYSGMYGQYAIAYPSSGIVVACTAGTDYVFQNNLFTRLTNDAFSGTLPEVAVAPRPFSRLRLRSLERRARFVTADHPAATRPTLSSLFLPAYASRFCGSRLTLAISRENGVGLMPLLLQAVQNDFTRGMQAIRFEREGALLRMIVEESGISYTVAAGIGRDIYSELNFNGERFLIGARCHFGRNEDGLPVLTVRVCFVEEANERILKFMLHPDHVVVRLAEKPDENFLSGYLDKMTAILAGNRITEHLLGSVSEIFPAMIVRAGMRPELHAQFDDVKKAE